MQSLIARVPVSFETKIGLLNLKEVLKDIKPDLQKNEREEVLLHLVSRYLNCSTKIPAKRVLSSFFQSLDQESQCFVKSEICSQLEKILGCGSFQIETARHNVSTIAALMENFKLGESCLSSIALQVIKYLAGVGHKFYLEVHADVPPVFLNEVMHHSHVTIQTLNLVLQKAVVDNSELLARFVDETSLLTIIWDLDTSILANELFLLDCRCCCAMNAVLILQLALPCQEVAHQIPMILLPSSNTLVCKLQPSVQWLDQTKANLLNMEILSTLSALAVAFGYIAMVHPRCVVHQMPTGSYFYLHVFLPALLGYSTRCTDTTSRTLYSKTVSLFATKLLECVQKVNAPADFIQEMDGDSSSMQSLLGYVWTNWEDQLDIVRQSAKVVFEKVLQLHCIVKHGKNAKENKCIASDLFLQSLVQHLFTVSWTSRGKFSALTSCVRQLGSQSLLDIRPDLPVEVIQQLQEQALSCYASELYCTLFASHIQEMGFSNALLDPCKKIAALPSKENGVVTEIHGMENPPRKESHLESSEAKFFKMWAEPVTKAMCTSRKKLKQNIVEYLLPRLLKSGQGVLNFLIQGLSTRLKDTPQQAQGAIIMCLHRARTLGFLQTSTVNTESGSLWLGYLSSEVLKEALCSMDDHIRLDAFALVCENSKTSEVVTIFEFEMLKFFIPHNINNQSPAFRQNLLAQLKKLMFRVKESILSLRRKLKGKTSTQTVCKSINDYECFLTWLTMFTVDNLYPGAAFARRTTSLAILSLLTTSFTSEKDGFCIPALLKKVHIQTLLGALTDTFEENKREALGILTGFLKHQEPIWDPPGTVETLNVALSLACSTRPQDCDTAVYIFLVLLKQQEFYPHKFDFAASLSSASGSTLELLDSALSSNPKLLLLRSLLQLLDSQISVAEQSLVSAAASRPMYPTLHCIRYILQELDFSAMEEDHMPSAKNFIKHLIISCLHLSRVVSPVVQNSSPEGNIPEEAVSGPDMPNAEWSRALVESMPEYLVVCGWRSIKEVSLTLGSLCLQLPTDFIVKEAEGGLLSLDQIEVIGRYFNQQLLESIHRGAFELAYAGFQLMCQMLWKHPLSCFHHLPSQWLTAVLQDIKSEDAQSRLCATRRSAGVPFLVQAITSTEPNLTGRQMFHNAMKELLRLALSQEEKACEDGGNLASSSDAQVHALNILRALYRESRLGDDVVLYVADGLKAAILGFRSEQWAVRNSATLLLSALMTRIFGVKRSKDESAMSKKNCQTGRAFFYRYPTLYPFLLSELEVATANVMSRDRLSLHPSLYPVLLVLGRLFPSTLEGSDTSLSLSAFIPYVIRCASSPVYKTRVIASRAIQPLAKRNEVIDIGHSLWELIPFLPADGKARSSHIHGSLLQLTQLITVAESFHETSKREVLTAFVENLNKRKWIFEKKNLCFGTRQAALILTDGVLNVADACHMDNGVMANTISSLRDSFVASLSDHETQKLHSHLPFFFEFEKTRAQLCLKHLVSMQKHLSSLIQDRTDGKDTGKDSNQSPQRGRKENEDKNSTGNSGCKASGLTHETGNVYATDKHIILLSLLKSPVYDVRLGVLDVLLSSLRSGDLDDYPDSHGSEEAESEFASESPVYKVVLPDVGTVVSGLYHQLVKMAMETETHHLCQEKVFYLLGSLPEGFSGLEKENSSHLLQMLSTLINRIQAERKTEIKAAVLRFTVRLVAILYKRIPLSKGIVNCVSQAETESSPLSTSPNEVFDVLINWLELLRESSSADENPELQISCCHCLLQNADILLVDPQNVFGKSVYTVWSTLAVLLQDDDLEVKEIAASVLCSVLKKENGSYQSSYALHILPSVLLSYHGSRDISGVLQCLISWILQDCTSDVKESNERLFDKGEMNTYLDHIAFTRSIMLCIEKVLNPGQSEQLLSSPQDCLAQRSQTGTEIDFCHQSFLRFRIDSEFVSFLDSCVRSLLNDLQILESSCHKEDMFKSVARFSSLCLTLHKCRLCLNLFIELAPSAELLAKSLNALNDLIQTVKTNLNVTNVLCL
ncbi:hypothetical protein EGW08_013851 [Elysia chlorotica]|uniref:tRNA (32-2'-O)-methyltransferase regulator THADA n=1 Tax=Elysia chlorotica TaxID=188477 RepID=A0A433TA35_ELYCH|nr:hypothetical protein EGW08_013851 [Elysia chlorotica]